MLYKNTVVRVDVYGRFACIASSVEESLLINTELIKLIIQAQPISRLRP